MKYTSHQVNINSILIIIYANQCLKINKYIRQKESVRSIQVFKTKEPQNLDSWLLYFVPFFFFQVSESVVNDDNNDGCKGKKERQKEGKRGLSA